ncbi:hypothetical protein BIV60_11430 [Bacillus sp. MUM 116]|uniref:hypothetical protein n=1 Tax=Bacillus sp. MUM 116 TaxID=1678002 RepID=UPI0008F5A8B2|nr:hypothetical protein [Bacillus sp. MUM 116]OIK14571.1 hypothetical protein BIV60_11430 [Bacillus sp. MUM 116]
MYLAINGSTDYLKAPTSINYDKWVIDCYIDGTLPRHQYIIGSNNIILRINANTTSLFDNQINQTGFTTGARTTITLTATGGAENSNVGIFGDGTNSTKGKIYSIKIYHGGVLKTYYNMNTGTLVDQSGNGNNGTLVGGTWMTE